MDVSYLSRDDAAFDMASGQMTDMFEPVLCTYIALDSLIERCGLSAQQVKVVSRLMRGYTCGDLADEWQVPRQAVQQQFMRTVQKIARQNDTDWRRTYTK